MMFGVSRKISGDAVPSRRLSLDTFFEGNHICRWVFYTAAISCRAVGEQLWTPDYGSMRFGDLPFWSICQATCNSAFRLSTHAIN